MPPSRKRPTAKPPATGHKVQVTLLDNNDIELRLHWKENWTELNLSEALKLHQDLGDVIRTRGRVAVARIDPRSQW